MGRFQDYIITDFRPGIELPDFRSKTRLGERTERSHFMLWLGRKIIEKAPYVEAVWFWKASPDSGGVPQHTHEHDEILGFFGTNLEDVYDLGGEIEFWMEDEKYVLTKSCLVFVPAGTKHCPLVFREVRRPIFHFLVVQGGEYK